MQTEIKIIELFIYEKGSKTIREISKKINSDYRITHIAIKRLIGKGAVLSKKVGNSVLCELNPLFYGIELYEAEDNRRNKLFKNKTIKQVCKEFMDKISSSLFVFLIFGSHAKGSTRKSSDIDIIFVSNEKGFEERVNEISYLLPMKIHCLVFTEEEFIRMKDSKESNVIQEAVKNNIIIYSIENYYRLKNA